MKLKSKLNELEFCNVTKIEVTESILNFPVVKEKGKEHQ